MNSSPRNSPSAEKILLTEPIFGKMTVIDDARLATAAEVGLPPSQTVTISRMDIDSKMNVITDMLSKVLSEMQQSIDISYESLGNTDRRPAWTIQQNTKPFLI